MLIALLTSTLQDEPKSTAFAWFTPGITSNVGKKTSEKGLTTEWTSGFVARCKPFVQAGWMELFLACSTGFFGKRIVETMNDWETDHAIFNTLKTFVYIIFPQCQAFHNTSILVGEVSAQLQHPVPPLLNSYSDPFPTFHCYWTQWVVWRQLYYKFNNYVLDSVSSHYFSSSSSSFNRHAIK